MAKMTFCQNRQHGKAQSNEGPIKVGDTGEFSKCGENDNIAKIANRAKHKAIRGSIKVGDTGEFGKYDEIDNFNK